MKDYASDRMKAWRKDFRVNSKTKTNNEQVKELYDIILANEMTDSDYWYFAGGDEFVEYLAHSNEKDIEDLMMDVPNWTNEQKWILSECLISGCMQSESHKKTKTFEYQSLLLTFLFSVIEDDQTKNDIFVNAEIINDGKPKPYDMVVKIKNWADNQISNYQNGVRNSYNPTQVHYDLIEAALKKAIR